MGPEGAVNVIYRDEIAKADDADERRKQLVDEYVERFANPYVAAARGYIDDVIEPRETRPRLIAALRTLATKRDTNPRRKHGNIPL
jgi:acetyl-CoA carboxylase carboxyltransferase component